MAPKTVLTPEEAARIMTRGDCHDNRVDCSTARDRSRTAAMWIMGIAATIVLATVGYISAANTDQWREISNIKVEVGSQETKLQNIDKKTDEMRQDIKELLKRR